MITTSWSITEMNRRKYNGEIYYVMLQCSVGIGSTIYASAEKAFTLKPNENQENMIPFENLSENQVIEWTKQVWNDYAPIEEEAFRQAVTEMALDKINNDNIPKWENESGLPWN